MFSLWRARTWRPHFEGLLSLRVLGDVLLALGVLEAALLAFGGLHNRLLALGVLEDVLLTLRVCTMFLSLLGSWEISSLCSGF